MVTGRLIFAARALGLAGACALFALATGCSEPAPTEPPPDGRQVREFPLHKGGKASLKGKITHKGEAIVTGRLCFLTEKGLVPVPGRISSDGSYIAKAVPEGKLKVFVLLNPSGQLPFPTPPDPSRLPRGGKASAGPPGPDGPGPGRPPMPGAGRPGPTGPPEMGHRPGPPGAGGPKLPGAGIVVKLPPRLLAEFTNFKVPPTKKKLYDELHRRYGAPSGPKALSVTAAAGENTHDIDLP